MTDQLLTTGEFAKLACTTKRTVHWYDKKGILSPAKVDQNGYRRYTPAQIIDFQVILLLRSLDFSLSEIQSYLKKKNSLQDLFNLQQQTIKSEIQRLQNSLKNIQSYYHNLDNNGTLIKPKLENIDSFTIYYIDKTGPYAKIKDYDQELASKFSHLPKTADFITLFEEMKYQPGKAKMKIGVVKTQSMKLKKSTEKQVSTVKLPSYKALTYAHYGPGASLSLMWKQLEKYAELKGYKYNDSLPFADLEFYRSTKSKRISNQDGIFYEIHLPVK